MSQQQASDTWNEFQADSLKRHIDDGDAAALRVLAPDGSSQAAADREAGAPEVAAAGKYERSQERLQEQARDLEHDRDLAEAQHRAFEVAEAAFRLAIVLGSIMIVAGLPTCCEQAAH